LPTFFRTALAASWAAPAALFPALRAAFPAFFAAPFASLAEFAASLRFRVAAPFLAAALRSAFVCLAIAISSWTRLLKTLLTPPLPVSAAVQKRCPEIPLDGMGKLLDSADIVVATLEDSFAPAERKLVNMGQLDRGREV
jgi:hypothetical protein